MRLFDDDDLPKRDVVSSDDALRDAFSPLTANQSLPDARRQKAGRALLDGRRHYNLDAYFQHAALVLRPPLSIQQQHH